MKFETIIVHVLVFLGQIFIERFDFCALDFFVLQLSKFFSFKSVSSLTQVAAVHY